MVSMATLAWCIVLAFIAGALEGMVVKFIREANDHAEAYRNGFDAGLEEGRKQAWKEKWEEDPDE